MASANRPARLTLGGLPVIVIECLPDEEQSNFVLHAKLDDQRSVCQSGSVLDHGERVGNRSSRIAQGNSQVLLTRINRQDFSLNLLSQDLRLDHLYLDPQWDVWKTRPPGGYQPDHRGIS